MGAGLFAPVSIITPKNASDWIGPVHSETYIPENAPWLFQLTPAQVKQYVTPALAPTYYAIWPKDGTGPHWPTDAAGRAVLPDADQTLVTTTNAPGKGAPSQDLTQNPFRGISSGSPMGDDSDFSSDPSAGDIVDIYDTPATEGDPGADDGSPSVYDTVATDAGLDPSSGDVSSPDLSTPEGSYVNPDFADLLVDSEGNPTDLANAMVQDATQTFDLTADQADQFAQQLNSDASTAYDKQWSDWFDSVWQGPSTVTGDVSPTPQKTTNAGGGSSGAGTPIASGQPKQPATTPQAATAKTVLSDKRVGNDRVITYSDGTQTTYRNYYAAGGTTATQQGTTSNLGSLLQSLFGATNAVATVLSPNKAAINPATGLSYATTASAATGLKQASGSGQVTQGLKAPAKTISPATAKLIPLAAAAALGFYLLRKKAA